MTRGSELQITESWQGETGTGDLVGVAFPRRERRETLDLFDFWNSTYDCEKNARKIRKIRFLAIVTPCTPPPLPTGNRMSRLLA